MFNIREIKNRAEYGPLSISKQAPFTQAWFYGEWQEKMGRKVWRFEVKENSEIVGFFQIIKYPLFAGRNLLYVPHAPVLRSFSEGGAPPSIFLKEFREKLLEIAEKENAVLARFDFFPEPPADLNEFFHKIPSYAYSAAYFQPKYEWVLDIDKPEGELFGNMHPKNRYNIRLAEKKGVAVEIIENDFGGYFENFYKLMEENAERNNFKLHPEIYYRNIFKNCEENGNAFLVLAKYENQMLAANLILLFGETAYFVFGGSSDEHKNLMAPHLSHWRGIIEAKNRGFKFYNFGAVSANGGKKEFEGISVFKERFGGRLLEYSDSYDLALKPVWRLLYNLKKKFWKF